MFPIVATATTTTLGTSAFFYGERPGYGILEATLE